MDLKHDLLYRVTGGGMKAATLSDELLLSSVKTEPRVHSPCDPSVTAPGVELAHHLSASSSGTATTPTPNGGSLFSGIASSNKRPRPDDWLSSPSPGSAGPLPPLTPSPGPPGHSYTVISNGYSSPMSSGSYDPYSPNGKIGEYCIIYY